MINRVYPSIMKNRIIGFVGRKIGLPYPRPPIINRISTGIKFHKDFGYIATERVIEHQFVVSNIKNYKIILDFGCTPSLLPIELAINGFEVYGIDYRKHPLTHRNFTFIQDDILNITFKSKFDCIISISTLEHIGLNVYNKKNNPSDLDYNKKKVKQVIEKFDTFLKPGGILLITVPIGKESTEKMLHCFDYQKFKELFKTNFIIWNEYHYQRIGMDDWIPCLPQELKEISNKLEDTYGYQMGSNSVSCFIMRGR